VVGPRDGGALSTPSLSLTGEERREDSRRVRHRVRALGLFGQLGSPLFSVGFIAAGVYILYNESRKDR